MGDVSSPVHDVISDDQDKCENTDSVECTVSQERPLFKIHHLEYIEENNFHNREIYHLWQKYTLCNTEIGPTYNHCKVPQNNYLDGVLYKK